MNASKPEPDNATDNQKNDALCNGTSYEIVNRSIPSIPIRIPGRRPSFSPSEDVTKAPTTSDNDKNDDDDQGEDTDVEDEKDGSSEKADIEPSGDTINITKSQNDAPEQKTE